MKLFIGHFDDNLFKEKLDRYKDVDFSLFIDKMPTQQADLSKINIVILQEPNEYFHWHDQVLANKNLFDLSKYDKDNVLYDPTNNKFIGKFKNECPNKQIINFVGLRSKLYSYKTDNNKTKKRGKGIKKRVK